MKLAKNAVSSDMVTELKINQRKGFDTSVPIRVITVELDTGEYEYLVTNVMDSDIFPETFRWLYFQRWKIESKYHELKIQFQLEEFNGATSISI